MTLRDVPGTDLQYRLVCFDKDGRERPEPDATLATDALPGLLTDEAAAVTDVFLLSHGWKGDVPAAIEQYDRWIGEMARCTEDLAAARRLRPRFRTLIVGLHWPSQPWGDEKLAADAGGLLSPDGSGDDGGLTASVDELVEAYADRLADTPAARDALRTILGAAQQSADPVQLPREVRDAYAVLRAEAGLTEDGDVAELTASDGAAWDAETVYQEARRDEGAGAPGLLGGGDRFDLLLSPLRQLSFWKMKNRARAFGESGANALLRRLLEAAPAATRFHLMGHSFGCIVVSAAVAGAPHGPALPRPVDSLLLVQGALSLWAYSGNIPFARGTAGYFHRIVAQGLVRGPIVTTRSEHDTAVGRYYPMAAKVGRQLVLAELPRYGGIGAFGAQGLGDDAVDQPMADANFAYAFEPGRLYNLEASRVIAHGDGASGAHSDIAHPEVAHAAWAAVLSGG